MNGADKTQPPLPCGEGAGGEGRANTPAPETARTRKLGHGYAPVDETRQKDRTRTALRAKRMRREMTPSEKKLWSYLREIEGVTFRRQVAVNELVYDFGAYGPRLLIELDGSIHRLDEVQERDAMKDAHAVANGFTLLRFKNDDVWTRPDWTLDRVREAVSACATDRPSPPNPLSARERGEEV